MNHRASLALLATALLGLTGYDAMAQVNPRSTFPGRRIGGGTRGECTARVLAHLVPPSSVYAPGADRTVGLLEGPANQPRPVLLEYKPSGAAGTPSPTGGRVRRDLPAAPAGITLLTIGPASGATIWESSYRCGSEAAAATDPLAFVETAAPPALSLVVNDTTPADRTVQAALARLRTACGRTVPRQQVIQEFGLGDVITAEWPAELPVRCL